MLYSRVSNASVDGTAAALSLLPIRCLFESVLSSARAAKSRARPHELWMCARSFSQVTQQSVNIRRRVVRIKIMHMKSCCWMLQQQRRATATTERM